MTAPDSEPPLLVITATRRRRTIDLSELWQFREVVYFLVWRDFKVRYRQTLLGIAWAVLQPLLIAAVFTLLFTNLADVPTDGVPYPLFVLAGLVPWQAFSRGISTATMGMIANQDLVRRVYFPRVAIPLATVLIELVDLAIGLLLLVAALVVFGVMPAPQVLILPLFLLLGLVATLGPALILCAANAQYRDVGYAVPFALQIALFLSPIAYPTSVLPEGWRLIYSLNPMVGVIGGIRWCLFGTPLAIPELIVSLAATIVALILGMFYFRHVERVLADVL